LDHGNLGHFLGLEEGSPALGSSSGKQLRVLRAELIGSDGCTAEGFSAVGAAPVLMLCRKLVEAGFDPRTPLEAWRQGTLALRVRSIGEAAHLEINSKGTGFVRRSAVRTASPVAKNKCGRAWAARAARASCGHEQEFCCSARNFGSVFSDQSKPFVSTISKA
jgi:hypothetical protein